jgi:hypothetical protein
MTLYRLMDGVAGRPGVGSSGTQPPAAPTAFAGNFLAGTLFSVLGQMAWLNAYWHWVPPGGDTVARKFCLWNRYSATQQILIPNSTVMSGTLTAGAFNRIPLAAPLQLAPGGLYVAATGWVAVAGFPDTNNQFAAAQPYAAGIVNGPLTGWSDSPNGGTHGWPGPSANYGLNQGLFGVAGSDPTVNMPASGSNSANFWMDVEVSDTAPLTYGGSYRLWPNVTDMQGGSNDTATNFTLATEFSLSVPCTVNNAWFYSPPGLTQLPTGVGVFRISDQALVASNNSPSWSGAAGAGWVSAPLAGLLAAGTGYKIAILNGAASPAIWNFQLANYWSAGFGSAGLTAGPVTAPNSAGSAGGGQETFNTGAALTYPASNVGPFHYGTDIEVTPVPPAAPGGNQFAAGRTMMKKWMQYADV